MDINQLIDSIPRIISLNTVKEIQKLSNLVELSKENKAFFNRLVKRFENDNTLFLEGNIDRTLDNINDDFEKSSFTGKELKSIISSYKFNQYNYTLLKLFKEMATLSVEIQNKKENKYLIEPVDIFTIIYIAKYIDELSEDVLSENADQLFYSENKYTSIFDIDDTVVSNPFKNFFNALPGIEFKTEALADSQNIDDFFYID